MKVPEENLQFLRDNIEEVISSPSHFSGEINNRTINYWVMPCTKESSTHPCFIILLDQERYDVRYTTIQDIVYALTKGTDLEFNPEPEYHIEDSLKVFAQENYTPKFSMRIFRRSIMPRPLKPGDYNVIDELIQDVDNQIDWR